MWLTPILDGKTPNQPIRKISYNEIYLSDGEHERLSALVRVVELCAVDEGGDVVEVDAVLPAHDLVPRAVAVAHRLDGQVLVQLLQRDVEDQHGVRRDDAAARS